jgi:putative glutamine amidotransferase
LSPPPTIGICAAWDVAAWGFWKQPAAIVADGYVTAVRRAGGLPLALIPIELEPGEADALVDRIDGLLLIGGSDLDPRSYGAEESADLEQTCGFRDRFELALTRCAYERDVPILGICRGLQILNVMTGGSIKQHLEVTEGSNHRPAPGHLDERTHHGVTVVGDSQLREGLGDDTWRVNSHHHQCVADLGAGARVIARADGDAVIEAAEWPERRHVVGVQWHPEALASDRMVARLVEAAS